MKKKEPCINTTAKLWISHILIYYYIFVILSNSVSNRNFFYKESLEILALSPLLGLMGFLDHFPGFFILQIILMLILYYRFFEQKIYKSYMISLMISYIILFILMYNTNGLKSDFADVNIFLLIIPSLGMTLSINWYLFGRYENHEKKISN